MYSEEVIEKLARVLAYYIEDGTMTEVAVDIEFPPSYKFGEPIKEGTREAFIEDTKTFFSIADKLQNRFKGDDD